MSRELLTLFDQDHALRNTFDIVVRERRVRFGDLLDLSDMSKELILEKLHRLEKESLIKPQDAPGMVEDLRWYSVTARGLAFERLLRRRRRLELA